MNPQQLQQQIALYYSKLPPDVQQVFSSMTWMESLKNISIRYGLNANQIETLGTETTLAFLGIIHLDEYEKTLENELGMPSTSVEKMIAEINNIILNPVRPQLTEAYERHVESLVEEKYGSKEKLDERFQKLPKEVQQAISESQYQSTLYTIANAQKLSVDQMGILEEATNKVLLGIIHPDKYEEELKSKIGLPSDKIAELVNSVNENVLKNIREILKSHWEVNKDNEVKDVDDEVPLPPYAKSPVIESLPVKPKETFKTPSSLSKTESGIYENAGIEVIDEKEKQEDDISKSIIGNKLSQITISKPVVSDHTLPKVATQPAPAPAPKADEVSPTKPHDPYHEAI